VTPGNQRHRDSHALSKCGSNGLTGYITGDAEWEMPEFARYRRGGVDTDGDDGWFRRDSAFVEIYINAGQRVVDSETWAVLTC
jgi:hypothetical protein